jgi:lactoylglutathione lyase
METAAITQSNVTAVVPFLGVSNMEASLKFYTDGLGFTMKYCWIPDRTEDRPDGRIRWCWLTLGDASLMLQEFWNEGRHVNLPEEKLGVGVSLNFQCADSLALYREFKSRSIELSKRPFVGNNRWVVQITDPDGYRLDFSSATDAPEESELQE